MRLRVVTPHGVAAVILALTSAPTLTVRGDVRAAGTRAEGLRLGIHVVGFELIRGVDQRRRINRGEGTHLGIAVWYPAQPSAGGAATMSAMDYHVLELSEHPTPADRQRLEAEEVEMLAGWRHVGIVPLTPAQAKASLATRGVAIVGAVAERRRFPLVLVLGGPYYLSTTAEVLASHGLLVVAPFRFRDQSNELETDDFRCYVEDSLGDAEWALDELRKAPRADFRSITAIGHGGGGMQAMLLAMRDRSISSVVNVDAGNFSSRSQPEQIAFYNPRLMRVPYLYIATSETRASQNRFDDFVAMKFADRTEVMLGSTEVRHHDLSDIGRGVTMPMRIRGQAQPVVERNYADVQEMVVRFVVEHSGSRASMPGGLSDWLEEHKATDDLTVTVRSAIEPAPTTTAVLQSLSDATVADLNEARQHDPEAAVFQERSLSQLVTAASARRPTLAEGLADFAVRLHPTSAVLLAQSAEISRGAGDRAKAVERARSCAGLKVDADWQASIAVAKCGALLQEIAIAAGPAAAPRRE